MSGTPIDTHLEKPFSSSSTREAAIAYLVRTGNADLLPILGLADGPTLTGRAALSSLLASAQGYACGVCGKPLPSTGVCRKSTVCRVVTAEWQDERWARKREASR